MFRVFAVVLMCGVQMVCGYSVLGEIPIEDKDCDTPVEDVETGTVLVACLKGVHAVDVTLGRVVQTAWFAERNAVAVGGGYAYFLTKNITVVRTADITTPVGALAMDEMYDFFSASLDPARPYLYLSTLNNGVIVVNVADPLRPVKVYQDYTHPFLMFDSFYSAKTELYIGGGGPGIVVYNMSVPESGVLLAQVSENGNTVTVSGVNESCVAVCLRQVLVLKVYDFSDPTHPKQIGKGLTSDCQIMASGNNRMYIQSEGTLTVYTMNGTHMTTEATVKNSFYTPSAALLSDDGTKLFIVEDASLGIFNVTVDKN